MATPKTLQDIAGFEYDWLASDGEGHVAFFSTAGGGYAPSAFLQDTDTHERAISELLSLPAQTAAILSPWADGNVNDWKQMAERGVFAFDSDYHGGSYKLIAAPARPARLDELPDAVAAVARDLQYLNLRFSSRQEISTELLKREPA